MSRTMKGILVLVMAAALAVAAVLGAGILRDTQRVRELEQELAQSRATWEKIAEEKEALQEDLKKVTEELKEARLTLEESTGRAEELREDLAQLDLEIAELQASVGTDAQPVSETDKNQSASESKENPDASSEPSAESENPDASAELSAAPKKKIDTGRMTCYNS